VIIGLDIDNVIFPFSEAFTEFAEAIHGFEPGTLDPEALSWSWYKTQWGWDTEKFLRTYVEAVKQGLWLQPKPRAGAVFNAWELNDAGHEIRYVTDRVVVGPEESIPGHVAEDLTREWLSRFDFPQSSNLHITGDKASVKTDVFLDDKPENVRAVAATGSHAILWGQPHNQTSPSLHRTGSWTAFRGHVRRVDRRLRLVEARSWDVV
jgi:hypothetical protein